MNNQNQQQSRRDILKYLAATTLTLSFGGLEALAGERNNKPSFPKNYELKDYVNAVIQIESSGNPRAARYEKHLDDWSYGLGQILTKTAKDIEKRHSELPKLGEEKDKIRESLFNPEVNRTYVAALFKEELDFYQDPFLAVAAYNSGHFTPRNARCQQQLNELYSSQLIQDGRIGKKSEIAVKKFQQIQGLDADGVIGEKTYAKLQEVWTRRFPKRENPTGIIPINQYTLNHVRKFKEALGIRK